MDIWTHMVSIYRISTNKKSRVLFVIHSILLHTLTSNSSIFTEQTCTEALFKRFVTQSCYELIHLFLWKLVWYKQQTLLLLSWLSPSRCNPMDCHPPGSSVHGISQTRILEWVAISFLQGSFWPRDWTHISSIGRWVLYHWATREALNIFYLGIVKS